MLNLVKNEYIKIFHKRSTYIFLSLLLLFLIVLPLLLNLIDRSENTVYTTTYDEEIAMNEDDDLYVKYLTAAKDCGIPESEFFGEGFSWRSDALSDIYFTFTKNEQFSYESDEAIKLIDSIKNNDWKTFYEYRLNFYKSHSLEYSQNDIETEQYRIDFFLENNIGPDSDTWQAKTLMSYCNFKTQYDMMMDNMGDGIYVSPSELSDVKEQMLIAKYQLDNNISSSITKNYNYMNELDDDYVYYSDFYSNVHSGLDAISFVLIISIAVAGTIISNEFSNGTIKFLLINPVTRGKIFWSKYITVFSYTSLLTIGTFIIKFIMSILANGFDEINTMYLFVENDAVHQLSGLLFELERYGLVFIELFIAFTMAFTISSLFRNSALAISLSMAIYFIGSTICQIAAAFNLDYFRYTMFANQSLSSIINGHSLFLHHTVSFAVIVIAVHIFLLLLTGYDAFKKKSV